MDMSNAYGCNFNESESNYPTHKYLTNRKIGTSLVSYTHSTRLCTRTFANMTPICLRVTNSHVMQMRSMITRKCLRQ